jgi:PQQ-like domain
MKMSKNKAAIAIALLLSLSMAVSLTLSPETSGQVSPPPGTKVPSYAFLNVAPNPVGVGQTVTLAMYLAAPLLTSGFVEEYPQNFTIIETTPDGKTLTLGPYQGDTTGGTFTTFIPDKTGNYTFQFFYGGQTLINGIIELPSHSPVQTLVVQEEPIPRSAYPVTPLPTQWWQTPVSAENVQNWYGIAGPWLGYGQVTFAATGGYNYTGNYNSQTMSVLSGHVLWTKPWAGGGVSGLSGSEESGHYWSTSQYWPKYAPVIINGIMYSTWYTATTGYSNGIMATDLYTGKTLWVLNTTNPLQCGMVTQWYTINAYGCIGPYIWTTGPVPGVYTDPQTTEWNMYDALTGKYVLSVVNGANPTLTTDENGNIIGYYINSTVGTMSTYGNAPAFGANPVTGQVTIAPPPSPPVLVCWNMSQALGNSWGWSVSENTVIDWGLGVMWAKPLPNETDARAQINNGELNNPTMEINGITDGAVVMTAGFTFGQFFGNEQNGWLLVGAMDANTGGMLYAKNFTETDVPALAPFTRLMQGQTGVQVQDGMVIIGNEGANWQVNAIDARTGTVEWHTTLTSYNAATPNIYDNFGLKANNGPGQTMIIYGLGGDIWCYNVTTGKQLWYTNTNTLIGSPGIETPYGIWPLWVFACTCESNEVAYLAVGHEYNPPLFHGAQLLAINITDGKLIWSELDMSIESTSIAYGILLSRNAYDNQIYAFGKGPSATTVRAPNVGVAVGTPITITGTVIDVCAGSKQDAVAANFPNGLPCVSDDSMSSFMEAVYQQQPMPADITGVPVTIYVLDSNNNYRSIGTTTSNAMGVFGFTWTPDIPGDFMVTAVFGGSQSYYGSTASAYFYASEAPAATPQPTQAPASLADQYILPGIGGIIAAIAVVGALILIQLRRK